MRSLLDITDPSHAQQRSASLLLAGLISLLLAAVGLGLWYAPRNLTVEAPLPLLSLNESGAACANVTVRNPGGINAEPRALDPADFILREDETGTQAQADGGTLAARTLDSGERAGGTVCFSQLAHDELDSGQSRSLLLHHRRVAHSDGLDLSH